MNKILYFFSSFKLEEFGKIISSSFLFLMCRSVGSNFLAVAAADSEYLIIKTRSHLLFEMHLDLVLHVCHWVIEDTTATNDM